MDDIYEKLDDIGAETEDALERFMGDDEMYQGYIRAFPEEPTYGALAAAVAAKDYGAAEKSVHALKGIVNNLGFLTLADTTVDMLLALRADKTDEALEAYDDLKAEYARYCDVIKAWRDA